MEINIKYHSHEFNKQAEEDKGGIHFQINSINS